MAKTESRPQIAFFKKVSGLEEKNHFMKVEQKKFCKPKPSDNFDPVLTILVQFLEKKTRKFDAYVIDNRREITPNGNQSQVGGAGIG